MVVKHKFESEVADDDDVSLVRPSDWNDDHDVGDLDKGVIGITVDGGTNTITNGIKGMIRVPCAGTITSWSILADAAGYITFDVWKDVIANTPPTIDDAITGTAKPILTASAYASSSTLTGWTTSFAAGDVFLFNVDTATTVKRVTLELHYTKG